MVVWYEINISLSAAANQKVSAFNATGADQYWDYRLFIEHLRRTFGNKQEQEDKIALLTNEALAVAGGDIWTEDSMVVCLRRALSEALKDELIPI
ncbi:hypothetical protein K3495_g13073 [Podosphaera aphanis]|nr:hypothetical protein K3495_g13073 [Podosphaera aphanis]